MPHPIRKCLFLTECSYSSRIYLLNEQISPWNTELCISQLTLENYIVSFSYQGILGYFHKNPCQHPSSLSSQLSHSHSAHNTLPQTSRIKLNRKTDFTFQIILLICHMYSCFSCNFQYSSLLLQLMPQQWTSSAFQLIALGTILQEQH